MEWARVEPVLRTTYELLRDTERVSQDAVCQALRRPPGDEETIRALALLYEDGQIGGFTVDQSPAPLLITSTPKGLRETSGWPSEGSVASEQLDLLLQILDERIASEQTPEEDKGRLRRTRDAVAGLGRDVAVEVLSAYLARTTGASGEG